MRSFFIAIGLFVCLWGGVFLLVDEMVLSSKSSLFSVELLRGWWTTWDDGRHAAFHPPEWAAFSLLSIGSLMMVYAIGLPPRTNNTPVRSLLDRNERRFHFAQNSHWSR